MSEAAATKSKQKWATEKPKLDKAGKLRGIYFIDPADAGVPGHFPKKCAKKVGSSDASSNALQDQRCERETCRTPDARKTKYACIVEADESTRTRLEDSLHKDHEDHIAGKKNQLIETLRSRAQIESHA